MKIEEARIKAQELRETLEYHSNRYYNEDSPEITDYEYDMMMRELKQLEKDFPELVDAASPTQHVGGKAKREAGVLVRHNVPMLSLQDVFSKEEVKSFVEEMEEKLDHPEFVVEYKIDGLSMSLRYENGKLVMAETRGDGIEFGEDVTENARVIDDVVQELKDQPEYLEIRGEVYMKNRRGASLQSSRRVLIMCLFGLPAGALRGAPARDSGRVCLNRKETVPAAKKRRGGRGLYLEREDGGTAFAGESPEELAENGGAGPERGKGGPEEKEYSAPGRREAHSPDYYGECFHPV